MLSPWRTNRVRIARWGVGAIIITFVAGPASIVAADDPTNGAAPTAGDRDDLARLQLEIRDRDGRLIPGRFTFLDAEGGEPELFPNADAAPETLAARRHVVYTLNGRADITIPPGEYAAYASRGLEWSIDSRSFDLIDGDVARWTATLEHEVDTDGWISADFHLHTLTYSGHGDSNLNERIISLVGEGVEFAVATDHNHNTDYGPTIDALGATDALGAVTGNEVSTPVGHFNAFPFDPSRPPVESRIPDARELFRLIRAETNAFGVTPVIQLNHPRWGGIDYFGQAGLDPITGAPTRAIYSDDFDSIELLNENAGWGYYDAETTSEEVGASRHWALGDWFNLLNRGHRYAAIGNSDSHRVIYNMAGYPRNFLPIDAATPGAIDPIEVADRVRAARSFTTTGPFVRFRVNGVGVGGDTVASNATGGFEVRLRVDAASWIKVDRAKIIVNGALVDEIEIPEGSTITRLDVTRRYDAPHDSWVVALVEGEETLAPIVIEHGRPVRALAVTNPVWIDADGDGAWTAPWDRHLRDATSSTAPAWPGDDSGALAAATERALAILAHAQSGSAFASGLIRRGLVDHDRRVRLAAARAAETLADGSLVTDLERAWSMSDADPYLAATTLRALAASAPTTFQDRFIAAVNERGVDFVKRYRDDLAPIAPGEFVTEWMAVGFFANPDEASLVTTEYAPESTPDLDATFTGKSGAALAWRPISASRSGYLDLRQLDPDPAAHENGIAYAQVFLHAPEPLKMWFALGTDDGARVWIGGDLVHDDNTRHGATPLDHFASVELDAGWNRVLFKVENGGGATGLYFRILDDRIRVAARPE
ncbi:MAG: CehA/McbA family metallohydrolase [Phycisphaerales bacterium]